MVKTYQDSLKSLTKGAAIILLGIIASKFLGYIYRLLVARIGPEEYGILTLGLTISFFLIMISTLGLESGILRYLPVFKENNEPGKAKRLIYSSLKIAGLTSILWGVILFMSADYIALSFFKDIRIGIILKILAFSIPFATLRNVIVNISKAYQSTTNEVVAKSIGENLPKIIITAILLFLGYYLLGAAVAYVGAMIISLTLSMYFVRKQLPDKKVKAEKGNEIIKEVVKYSWPLIFNSFLIVLISWFDTIMIGIFKSPYEVGIYNAAMPTAMLISIFPKAIQSIFLPVLSSTYERENGKENIEKIYRASFKWIFLISILSLAYLVAFAKTILHVLFGAEYAGGSLTLIILTIGFFAQGLFVFSSRDLLMLLKKTKLVFILTLTAVLVNIILNFILIPQYGIIGASIATSFSFVLMSLLMVSAGYKMMHIHPFKMQFLKILGAISIATVLTKIMIILLPFSQKLLQLIISGIILSIIYGGLLILSKSFDEDDIYIIKMIKSKTGLELTFLTKFLKRFR